MRIVLNEWDRVRLLMTLMMIGLIAPSITACGRIIVPGFTLQNVTWRSQEFRAGAGQVDITPPPGYPTGGHGPSGNIARGYWTRLYARAFVFIDPNGQTLVLVSCDLFAIPAGLTAAVARAIGTEWDRKGIRISPDSIIIAATHTHQGPGNFLSAPAYNEYGSKYPGVSKSLFWFLVEGVRGAIDIAIEDARGHSQAQLYLRTGRVTERFLLNRSPNTFLANWNSQTLMDRLNPPGDPITADC